MDSSGGARGSTEYEQPDVQRSRSLRRVPSGISGLDTILHGGFLGGGTYLVMGQPGTGKTILSNQIAFNHVASGGNVVFVSVLAETHSRLFSNLSSLSFFDDAPIGSKLLYIGGYGVAQKEGLQGLFTLMRSIIHDNNATMLIVDGVLNAEAYAASAMAFKEFVHQLQVYAEFSGCTVLLLSSQGSTEGSSDQVAAQTIVDGLIQLSRRREGMRLMRELEVLKLRGSSFMEGGHTLQITMDGLVVYPRPELVLGASREANGEPPTPRLRLPFGIARLDEMLHGGLLARSTTMLLGPPGSGKTVLGLQFLAAGARAGQSCLYYGLNEAPPELIEGADQISLDLSSLVETGQLSVLWEPAVEVTLEVLAARLLLLVREKRVERLLIDGLDAVGDFGGYSERLVLFLRALATELRALGVTTLFAIELSNLFGPTVAIPLEGVSAIMDNIIFLRYVELRSQLYRLVSILKTRRSGADAAIREFSISEQGIVVADTFASAEAILTGVARPLPMMPSNNAQEPGV